jgi:hypothetical protein
MITKCCFALLQCCFLLFLCACPGVPPSPGETVPPADSSPAAGTDSAPEKAGSLREALVLSSRVISEGLDAGASVAIISITAADPFEGEYALEELTFLFVRTQKFRVVDRRSLDIIRAEQQFQLSGEVDDETAVSIGHLIGAAFVITGGINPGISHPEPAAEPGPAGRGSPPVPAKYLRLRVLDVQTGQIRAMSSVTYGGDL